MIRSKYSLYIIFCHSLFYEAVRRSCSQVADGQSDIIDAHRIAGLHHRHQSLHHDLFGLSYSGTAMVRVNAHIL